jgi:hypothetical protein
VNAGPEKTGFFLFFSFLFPGVVPIQMGIYTPAEITSYPMPVE